MNLVTSDEPFKRLLTQGMVLGPSYYSENENKFLFAEEVKLEGEKAYSKATGEELIIKVEKMSKSKNNGVDPEEMIEKYGADTTRLFIMFAAPPEKELEWNENGLAGAYRFLTRIWRLITEGENYLVFNEDINLNKVSKEDKKLLRKLHQTIKKVTDSIENDYHFNTAIAATMELINEIQDYKTNILDADNLSSESMKVFSEAMKNIVVMLSPFVPHFSDELWNKMGNKTYLFNEEWPNYNEKLTIADEVEIAVQVNGKVRGTLEIDRNLTKDEIEKLALGIENVKKHLEGKEVVKIIVIPGKIVNIVIKG
jgi:leucyl-tRNA synthetase